MPRRSIALILAILLSLSAPLRAQTIGDRELFSKSLKVAQQAVAQYGRYENEAELQRVNRIGYELAQHSSFTKFPFTFELVDVPVPNAFALPGGQIFVTRGMLDLGLTDDMLANLLGHELSHVTLAHYARMQKRATLMTVLSQVLLAGVILGADRSSNRQPTDVPYDPRVGYGDSASGDLIQGAAAASLVVSELLLRSYSRENEDEADDEGQRLAAAAGYDPAGARQLWELMIKRFPESKEYGYWRTHPFPDERSRAADVRQALLKISSKGTADDFRLRTQAVLVNYLEHEKPTPEEAVFLKEAIVTTWPRSKSADSLRLEELHQVRDEELAKPLLSRDYGQVLRAYRETRDTVRELSPKSEILPTLEAEIADLAGKVKELYPKAAEVLGGGVYETLFLVSFLSNFPEAPEVPDVALALGDAYSRLGNPTDAVTQYLKAWQTAPESDPGRRAAAGLRHLAPSLKQLAALQQLADQDRDPELKRLASGRLVEIAKTYDDVANGAEYLKLFPESGYVTTVIGRLNTLADNLYGEVVLYQGVGDNLKAMERINKILTHAPLSPAAERLRDRALLEARS